MFSPTIAARAVAACGFAVLLATATTACGSSSSSHSSGTSSAKPASVTQSVTDAFEQFFDGKTTADQKIAVLQNGQAFAAAIKAQNDSPMAKSTTATVSNVASTGTDHADVTYTIQMNGKDVLPGQKGAAIQENGSWKVTDSTFCALLTLEQNAPPACKTVSPSN